MSIKYMINSTIKKNLIFFLESILKFKFLSYIRRSFQTFLPKQFNMYKYLINSIKIILELSLVFLTVISIFLHFLLIRVS